MLLAATLAGCTRLDNTLPKNPLTAEPSDQTVFVLQRGHHTDIGFFAADLSGPLAAFHHVFPPASTILFGFGDRTFVTHREKTIAVWLLALVPGDGAILATGLRTTPQAAFGAQNVVVLHVTRPQLEGIEHFVADSVRISDGKPEWIGNGPYLGSVFYASPRTYSLLTTCNTWTAAALRAGGLDEPVVLTLFATQAMRAARRLNPPTY